MTILFVSMVCNMSVVGSNTDVILPRKVVCCHPDRTDSAAPRIC